MGNYFHLWTLLPPRDQLPVLVVQSMATVIVIARAQGHSPQSSRQRLLIPVPVFPWTLSYQRVWAGH